MRSKRSLGLALILIGFLVDIPAFIFSPAFTIAGSVVIVLGVVQVYLASSTMRSRSKAVVVLTTMVALGFFLVYPAVYVNAEGQTFLFGHPTNQPQCSGLEADFGCHCASLMSLSSWLFVIGYRQSYGCP